MGGPIPGGADGLPRRVAPLSWPSDLPLEEEGEAGARPYVLAGRRAALLGQEADGAVRVDLHPTTVLRNLDAGGPAARRIRISPGLVRRIPVPATAGATETSLVFRELAGAVIQWRGSSGEPSTVAWDVPLPEGTPAPGSPGAGVPLLELFPPEGGRVAFVLLPAPRRWDVSARSGPDGPLLRIRARLPGAEAGSGSGDPVTLVVAGSPGDPGAAGAVLRRLGSLEAEAVAWARSGRDRLARGPWLESSEPAVDRALAWASLRMDGALVRPRGRRPGRPAPGYGEGDGCGDPGGWIWTGHGLLALGRLTDAADLLRWAAANPDEAGVGSPPERDPGPSLFVHLAARWLLTSGAPALPGEVARTVDRIARVLRGTGLARAEDGSLRAGAAAALRALADAWEAPGRPVDVAPLREGARALETQPHTPGFPAAAAGAGPGEEGSLAAWAAWARGEPERAFDLWRLHALSGLDGARGLWPGSAPPGASPHADGRGEAGCAWSGPATALVAAAFVHGLLGFEPDAAFGRLTLTPRIPARWDRLEVRGLTMGDLRVGLGYRRIEGRHTFVLDPLAGAVPPNVVFQPLLSGSRIRAVEVDDEAADVEEWREAGRAGIRLQLPLDGTREVRVDADERA